MNKQELKKILEIHAETARLYVPNFDLVIQLSEHEIFKNLEPHQEISFNIFAKAVNPGNNQKYLFSDLLDTWYEMFLYFLTLNNFSSTLHQRTKLSTEIITKLQQLTNSMMNIQNKNIKISFFKEFINKINKTEQDLLSNYPVYIRHMEYGQRTLYLNDFLKDYSANINLIEIFLWQILSDQAQAPDTDIPNPIIVSAVDNQYWFDIKGKALTSIKVAEACSNEGLKTIHYAKSSANPNFEDRFTQAIKFNPEYKDAYQHRYSIRRQQGNHLLAIEDLIKLKSFNPSDIMIYQQLAENYLKVANTPSALKDAKLLLKSAELALENINLSIIHNDENACGYFIRGMIYVKLNKPDFAIADFTQAIKFNPIYFEAFFQRGEIYLTQGIRSMARDDFKAALKINPNSIVARARFENSDFGPDVAPTNKNNFWLNQDEEQINQRKRKLTQELKERVGEKENKEEISEESSNEEHISKKSRYV